MPSCKLFLVSALAVSLVTVNASASEFHKKRMNGAPAAAAPVNLQTLTEPITRPVLSNVGDKVTDKVLDGVAPVTDPILKLLHAMLAPVMKFTAPVVAPLLKPVEKLTGASLQDADALTRPLTGKSGSGGGAIAELAGPLGTAPLTGHSDPLAKAGADAVAPLPSVPELLKTPLNINLAAPNGVMGTLDMLLGPGAKPLERLLEGGSNEERSLAEDTDEDLYVV
ncbi:hypothetical protein RQP46_000644 [Phenoliferia psychrophenolica]